MLNRLTTISLLIALIPFWGWAGVAVFAVIILLLTMVVMITGSTTSALSSDFHYQCDSAIGPDASIVGTANPGTEAGGDEARYSSTETPSAAPTTNPYASLTVAPEDRNVSDWQRSCLTAMRQAPYQLPPLRTANVGGVAQCAGQLALSKGQSGGGASAGSDDSAALARDVIAEASLAALTGRCGGSGSSAAEPVPAPAATDQATESCARITRDAGAAPTTVTLPGTVAAQAACGQRVAKSAMSAGDLVFWDFRNNAPTRVGVAVGGTQLVTVDPSTGRVVELAVPGDADVRVKRVLRGDS
ncbi:cell wall-associated NlpC family hydrolase [Nocardia transvalensis]|uniref:Cell wall-associated NlpC family hydrolase n=1 Tax=Nocardia transvalensis TaxID=37333 RepID=A0A7W9PM99_9NOCA|nr:NlpC/P60 family protein [Nocardia transvalensis]MBB5918776.1 cell wall-associated NlpC family hydrolase [Nocardia transvalensis]